MSADSRATIASTTISSTSVKPDRGLGTTVLSKKHILVLQAIEVLTTRAGPEVGEVVVSAKFLVAPRV